nr:hypothetical protein CDS [Bradyrhizobium sp.]
MEECRAFAAMRADGGAKTGQGGHAVSPASAMTRKMILQTSW